MSRKATLNFLLIYPKEYSKTRNAAIGQGTHRGWWWLRTNDNPYRRHDTMPCFQGTINPGGFSESYPMDVSGVMARPAMWVTIKRFLIIMNKQDGTIFVDC